MNHIEKFRSQIQNHLIGFIVLYNVILIGFFWIGTQLVQLNVILLFTISGALAIISSILIAYLASKQIYTPFKTLQQAILHVAPATKNDVESPSTDNLSIGRELIASLVGNIYQIANIVDSSEDNAKSEKINISANYIANKLPLPLIILDKNETIVFANKIAKDYLGLGADEEIIGKSAYTLIDMSFLSAFTLNAWLKRVKETKPAATQTWERVKLTLNDDKRTTKLFDLAAYYNQDNPNNFETILVLFDHTEQYSQDDQAMSFVALAVHELRSPLTLLRGYIEVFRDELTPKVDPEIIGFLFKMDAAAQQLNYYVNNILNVARAEQTGLNITLRSENWEAVLRSAVNDMELRASIRGLHISVEIEPNLPPVGVDRFSIYEVLCNLLDNALKYSGDSKNVIIKSSLNGEGMVETTIEDYGVGIPESSMKHLFDKFYRDHHKRDTVGGTGLGLYLSKLIVNAHEGKIWVRSKLGEGSTFGFTVMPFDKIPQANEGNPITRSAHGWIKNHSLYRD